ncbi:DedA family protein, partial [Klebsiella pneumoniae]
MSTMLAVTSLFGSSFLSATLLPGNSEILLIGLLSSGSASPLLLVAAASF